MRSLEILRALQAGTISAAEAKRALAAADPGTALPLHVPVSPRPQDNAPAEPANQLPGRRGEAVAIVGMSGRYPGAGNLDQYWRNVMAGKNAIREIPAYRWDVDQYYDPRPHRKGKMYCKWLGLLDDIAEFDPLFFSLSPAEAEWMDPQHRIFLQEAYKAFEDAGYGGPALSNKKCGVYLGIMSNEYGFMLQNNQSGIVGATGNSYSIAAARIAYFLNLKGPALAIDTACSSSLVATHLGCQALLSGEVDMALAGGVSLYLTPASYISMCSAGMLARDGQCKTFDNAADGFVPGEGAGALVLKRLSDAEADHDVIYGVIIGSGINQDGKTNGITAPSVSSQIELERGVYDKFGIHPGSISYVETHGTGTKLGDPIELEALSTVFAEKTARKRYCALGSVKSNIGHTSAAAGVAGVQKVLLSMKHQLLAPTLNVHKPNELFNFEDSPFYINKTLQPWEAEGAPRRAAVSSFGFSGTNAHLVIEEYRPAPPTAVAAPGGPPGMPALLVLSAATREQLVQYAVNLKNHLADRPEIPLADLAYTLQVGRRAMEHRLAFVAATGEVVPDILENFIRQVPDERCCTGRQPAESEKSRVASPQSAAAALVTDLVAAGQWQKLARAWAEGADIHWEGLYGPHKPRRVSLPPYPFATEQYWLPVPAEAPAAPPAGTGTRSLLQKSWTPDEGSPIRPVTGTVVILATPQTAGLATLLAGHFPHSETWMPDQPPGPAADPADWQKYAGLIDLAGCGESAGSLPDWIGRLQQLIEHGNREGLVLLGVTKGLEAYQNASVNLAGATRAGLYRLLQEEYKYVHSRHLDLDAATPEDLLARQIADEFRTEGEYPEICVRKGQRYRAVLTGQQAPFTGGSAPAFPAGGVLWVTGGTRGIGYQCARHFVQRHGVRNVVLTGRTEMPPRTQWAALLQTGSPLAEKIKSVQSLESLGARVLVLSVTLTDAHALRESVQQVKAALGPIGGVIHSAGITDRENPAFIRKTPETIARVLTPKVEALEVLFDCLRDEPLQFFALFSSVAAAIPALGAGQSDYAMANAYMDYFATARRATCPITSIQWPSWKETGFGEVKTKAYAQTGLLSHTNAEGLALLDLVLGGQAGAVVLPAHVRADAWAPEQLLRRTPAAPLGTGGMPKAAARPDAPGQAVAYARDWLTGLIAKELKIDASRLDPDKEFQVYGIDSIILAQLVVQIDRGLRDVHLEPSALIEHPTIRSLARYLAQAHPEAVLALRGEETGTTPPPDGTADPLPAMPLPARREAPRAAGEKAPGREDKIAVVGMACHFPDAVTPGEYWQNLKSGRDSIREVPASRWDWKKYYHPGGTAAGKSLSKWGAFLPAIEAFDPDCFNIAQALAPYIDPIQRQWLEVSTEALADAGYGRQDLWGKPVGVFAGARTGNFGFKFSGQAKDRIVGVGQNFVAAHLAHIFNFKGPNLVVDTACSSSLTALHLAVRSLRSGESEIALAGGVDILLDEGLFVGLSEAKILSPRGRCQAFSAHADGIGLGEGCGVLVLKPLEKAIRDNNKIYGVIEGSAVNNDGNTMGVTTPNPDAQRELVEAAIDDAKIPAGTISYVEAHGTGTLIGDPIELRALTRVFAAHTSKKQFCGVGSVKSNIGHLLSAAGSASIIKVLLSLVHRQLPPTLHCDTPNPRFNFGESPLYLVQRLQPWTAADSVLRAGISSFGLGGNNAHVIVSNEGVPASRQAVLEPATTPVTFNRRRYWPAEPLPGGRPEKKPGAPADFAGEVTEEDDFMKLFRIEEVKNDA